MEIVEQRIKDNKVMVFSKTTCPFCTKIKNLFDSLGFKYEVLELDQLGKFFNYRDIFLIKDCLPWFNDNWKTLDRSNLNSKCDFVMRPVTEFIDMKAADH